MKFILFFLAFCITFSKITKVFGEEWGNMHISYIREVNNQLYLSDFQLGSEESIKDNNGHGFSLGWLIKNEGGKFFLFNTGISNTYYHGTIEDGVNVSFRPQSGSGYESLSQSKNIFYEILFCKVLIFFIILKIYELENIKAMDNVISTWTVG